MPYAFLEKDLEGLDARIEECRGLVQKAEDDRTASLEGEETHENLGFSSASSDLAMWEQRLTKLLEMRRCAEIITTIDTSQVSIGTAVVARNPTTGAELHLTIGGHQTFEPLDVGDAPRHISYLTPMAQLLMGAKPNECREGLIRKKPVKLEIVSVAQA